MKYKKHKIYFRSGDLKIFNFLRILYNLTSHTKSKTRNLISQRKNKISAKKPESNKRFFLKIFFQYFRISDIVRVKYHPIYCF